VNRAARLSVYYTARGYGKAKRRVYPTSLERAYILPYAGYTTDGRVLVRGRVLRSKPPKPPRPDDGAWRNLRNTLRRFRTKPVRRVELACGLPDGGEERFFTDGDGYFDVRMPAGAVAEATGDERGMWAGWREGRTPADWGPQWAKVRLRIAARPERRADVPVVRTMPQTSFGVISDVDDTVVVTGATSTLTQLKHSIFWNAHSRVPFAGAAALYRALHRGPEPGVHEWNPVFYVSSSAWNLYDLFVDFFRINGFPLGPIHLRDLGLTKEHWIKSGHDHKLREAERIIDSFPGLPFLLIGDSGQKDATLYTELCRVRPGRVRGVVIRDLKPGTPNQRLREAQQAMAEMGIPFLLERDSFAAAEHLAELGFVQAEALREVLAERERDEQAAPAVELPRMRG